MSKKDLIDAVSEHAGESKKSVDNVLKALVAVVTADLKDGSEVSIRGLGKFSARDRSARMGRNPATGEAIEIGASVTPKFTASKTLKDALNP